MSRKKLAGKIAEVSPVATEVNKGGFTTVIVACVLFLLFSVAFNYLTPASTVTRTVQHPQDGGAANPDEPAHYLYVSSVAHGHLPVFSKSSPDYEAHQPPAYYGAAAIVYKLSPEFHAIRWVATLFGLALIWVTFLIVRELLPDLPMVADITVLIIAMLPMNISLSSSISNDTLTNLIFALFLLVTIRLMNRPKEYIKYGILLGLVLGAGAWTKSSTYLLMPLTIVVFAVAFWKKQLNAKNAAVSSLMALGSGLIIALPWMMRNHALYGDLFAQSIVFHVLASRNVSPNALISQLGEQWYLTHFVSWTFESYWGVFDSMLLFLPAGVYATLALVAIVCLVAGVAAVIKLKRTTTQSSIIAVWAMLICLTVVAYLQYNVHFFQLQGRYLYPALIPLSTLSAMGLYALMPQSYRRWTLLVVGLGMSILNLLCLSIVSGRYS